MTLSKSDWKQMHWAIALLIILSLLGGAAVWGTFLLQKEGEKALRSANASKSDIQARLTRAREEEQELRDKITRFQKLIDRGYIGQEKRLDWLEAIARIKAARKLFKLDYEFSPQRPADSALIPAGSSAGGYDYMSSQMKLQLQLLHEGDLFGFISDLRQAVNAVISVRNCKIERIGKEGSERGNNAQLKAECVLEWVTLKERK